MGKIDIREIVDIAEIAGKAILEVYHHEELFNLVDYKSDDSPLTLADKQSHEIIAAKLKELYPGIPVLSEEGKNTPYEARKGWDRFWLVDPLDGTKEFIKRNGEFTVNIALIEKGYPVLGVIHTPVTGITYGASKDEGAFRLEGNRQVKINGPEKKDKDLVAVRSRSHASPEEEEVFGKFFVSGFVSVGSSLKFCMVAEGKADLYYRHGPTMEWDTAAGQAIVEEAGCTMVNLMTKKRFRYNKESLLNPGFMVDKK
ncbi:MAG: 3'(2'),5'-bisphosphate nucleotidase CysQ [Cyclobacteriaceae bacterium]|nr:3'(2'),5'-bisphosphate nucleotidase CysQ [Cyclobacteriaceae bacterium]